MGVCSMGCISLDVHLMGVHPMDIRLISVYLMGVHLIGHTLHGACTSWAYISLGVHFMGVVYVKAFRSFNLGVLGKSPYTPLEKDVAKSRITEEIAKATRERLRPTTQIEDLSDVDFVIEAVPEIPPLKAKIFAQLAEICPKHAIPATNTSSISITKIAAATTKNANDTSASSRVISTHFMNPVLVQKGVEITIGVANGVLPSHSRHVTPMPPSLPSAMAVKFFKRAMRELVRLADKKIDISNARAEAVQCAREATTTAEADAETARRLKLFAYTTREKWFRTQSNPEKNPYNWPAIIEYWQDEGHRNHVANHTKVAETWCQLPYLVRGPYQNLLHPT
jgi:3-hydroxyacyl-CoA dehydrogenase, NAD binding domain